VGGDLLQVVYVEDNPSNMRLMRDLVNELEGVELTLAPSAEQGLEAAKHIVPDILFIDINLPGMNGMQLLSLLKGMPALQAKGTRFYALSANAMQEDVQKALQLGFDDYLAKPIDILEIQTLLQALRNT
jgi:CheY-like chemotaxis protein